MAWVPAVDNITVATHIEPTGTAADANNINRTSGEIIRLFSQTLIRQPDYFQPNIVDPK